MYLTKSEVAALYGMCINTVSKRMNEMMESGRYPTAFKQPKRATLVDLDQFDAFLIWRAANGGKHDE